VKTSLLLGGAFDHRTIAKQIEINGEAMSDLERKRSATGQIKIIERCKRRKQPQSLFSERLGMHTSRWELKKEAMPARASSVLSQSQELTEGRA
jgi:hypothetical protein